MPVTPAKDAINAELTLLHFNGGTTFTALPRQDDGTVQPAELKLGQHVEVQHDGQLVATQVRVVAQAEGLIEELVR